MTVRKSDFTEEALQLGLWKELIEIAGLEPNDENDNKDIEFFIAEEAREDY